jgi:hypothetical protein
MPSLAMSRHEAKYLASRALLGAGFTHEQVGLAMLALEDREDFDPETMEEPEYTEPEPFVPSEEDWQSYELWLERLEAERGCGAWVVHPVR